MGLEALGEDWSLSLLGPRDRLEAAVRPALARLSRRRPTGARAASVCPPPSGAAAPLACRSGNCWTPCPAYSASRWRRSTTGGGRAGTPWSCRPRCQIPDGCPARLPASAWSLCRRGPDGIAANWPWTASRRCCCSVRCPRRRCRWRRPGACWRACTNRPSSGACATSCNWATRCSAASARSAPGAACCSPRNLRVPARNACWSIWRPSSSAPPALAQLPARRLAGLREALADDLRRAPGSFAERARRAWAEHLGGGAGRSPARRGRPRPERRRPARGPGPVAGGAWRLVGAFQPALKRATR